MRNDISHPFPTVQLFTFGNELVISSHTLLGMSLLMWSCIVATYLVNTEKYENIESSFKVLGISNNLSAWFPIMKFPAHGINELSNHWKGNVILSYVNAGWDDDCSIWRQSPFRDMILLHGWENDILAIGLILTTLYQSRHPIPLL